MASGRATVKAVISGDTIVLVGNSTNGPPPELVLTLSSLQAPKLARTPDQTNEPYAWASREFLRQFCIGKQVRFKVEYSVPSIKRDFGSVWMPPNARGVEENLCVIVARNGWAKVKSPEMSRDGKCIDYEKLQAVEVVAIQQNKGMYADTTSTAATPSKDDKEIISPYASVKWQAPDGPTLLKEWEGKLVPGIIEAVRDGASMRVILKPSLVIVNFALAGIQCPRMNSAPTAEGEAPTPPAPHAREAKFFTESRLLHRDVNLKLQGCDKFGNLFGSVIHSSGKNITVELLRNGFARMVDWSAMFVSPAVRSTMRAAEKEAKNSQLRVWRDYVAPIIQSEKEYRGTVVEVVSGDCVVIHVIPTPGSAGEERRVYLSSLRAPRLGNPRRDEANAPYAVESKEMLRHKAIGKQVKVIVEYEKATGGEGSDIRTFASILMEQKNGEVVNFAVELVQAGLAEVVRHRADEEKSGFYDDLITAETKAQSTKKGIYSGKEAPEHRYTDLCFDPTKAKQYLPFLKRERDTRAVVEYVYSATRVKLYIPKENCMVNFFISGIKCPQPAKYGTQGVVTQESEEWGEEAKLFTKRMIMQRSVVVEVEDMDRGGNAFGSMYVGGKTKDPKFHFGAKLLREGYAYIDDYSVDRTNTSEALKQAEAQAKGERKNYWKTNDPIKAAAKAMSSMGLQTTTKTQDDTWPNVRLSEIIDATHFFIQNVNDSNCTAVEKAMKEFTRANGVNGKALEIRKNTILAGLFDGESGGKEWNRARVEAVLPNGSARVRFIDYGNTTTLSPSEMRPLDSNVLKYPPQAKECVFAFLKPLPPSEEYGVEAAQMVGDLAWGKTLTARIHGTDESNRLIVSLFDKNTKLNIAEQLLEHGVVRVDRKAIKSATTYQQDITQSLTNAQASAKKKRVCLWRYGDVESDDE